MHRTPAVLLGLVAALLAASACAEDEGGEPGKGAAAMSGDTFPADTANPVCALPGVNRLCSFIPHDVVVRLTDFSFLLTMARQKPATMLPLFSLERGVAVTRDLRRPTTTIQPIPGHHLPDSVRQR